MEKRRGGSGAQCSVFMNDEIYTNNNNKNNDDDSNNNGKSHRTGERVRSKVTVSQVGRIRGEKIEGGKGRAYLRVRGALLWNSVHAQKPLLIKVDIIRP